MHTGWIETGVETTSMFLPAKSEKNIVIGRKGREKNPSECLNTDKLSDNALQNRVNKKSEAEQV